jgi:hypothetical protein
MNRVAVVERHRSVYPAPLAGPNIVGTVRLYKELCTTSLRSKAWGEDDLKGAKRAMLILIFFEFLGN